MADGLFDFVKKKPGPPLPSAPMPLPPGLPPVVPDPGMPPMTTPPQMQGMPSMLGGPRPAGVSVNKEQIEEIAESIVQEKWDEFNKELLKLTEWKDKTESRVDKLEQSLADVKSDLDNLHKAIVSKIGDYDKNLLDVGTEIKAMEKVFKQVLPTLTENVAELSRITRKVKADKKAIPENRT